MTNDVEHSFMYSQMWDTCISHFSYESHGFQKYSFIKSVK